MGNPKDKRTMYNQQQVLGIRLSKCKKHKNNGQR